MAENCAPPAGTPGYVVAERLRTTCGVHGSITQFRAYLELSAPHTPPTVSSPTANVSSNPDSTSYPPTSPKTLALRSELQSSGVSLIDCPHDSRKNVADAMLACDLVCFALDHPATPPTPHPSLIPSSPYSIPSTPFSCVAPPVAPPKTTVVLVSGDRDFAYPLAVLKARKYDVGLIVPAGGAHPALRAQASWVLNWKDVMEDTGPRDGTASSVGTKIATHATGQTPSLGAPVGVPSQPTEPRTSPRRSSFASRRGSVSSSLRASSSSPSPIPPLPPPPPPAESSTSRGPTSSPVPSLHIAASGSIRRPPLPPPPPEELPPQLPPTPRMSRRPSIRRAAKAASRPPSRSRSRVGAKGAKPDNKPEQGVAGTSKTEQKKPQPTIIPVPLTVSPVGSDPSFAAMSPQGHGRPHTPPLFSTHPVSPPPPAAPPSLAPPPTPPAKSSTPPTKPPTPPRDATRTPHRPSVPHVSTPRPPVPTPQEPAISSKVGDEASPQGLPAHAALPAATILQSLVPAAPALRPTNVRLPLTVPSFTAPATNSSTLTPATPVTPPASPPSRIWARLQPVNDETDADGDQATAAAKRAKKGKERSTEDLEVTNREKDDGQQHGKLERTTPEKGSNAGKEPTRLAVDVGIAIKISDQPSAISGVDSILRSYSERTPCAEYDNQPDHFDQACEVAPIPDRVQAPAPEDEDEEEEKFDESYFASLARSPPAVSANWTPPAAPAPRTPGTVKAMPLDFILGDSTDSADGSPRPPLSTTPRPLLRTHSLPIGVPIIQTLLAGLEVDRSEFKRNSLGAHIELLESVRRDEMGEQRSNALERVYSRVGSPSVPPPFVHRNTLSSTSAAPITFSTLGLSSNPSADSTYREFRVLIDALERYRRDGNDRPLRSRIGTELSREVFESAGVSSFREYVSRASAAGVVDVGGGSVQGREWISLSRQWQGINSGFE
ncbi:hypothetical protein FRC06_002573 [Ceratobasidium sp. 370]|nr:hypothetical protein FRC06_002573 [Ceratobasidium sp. 370]